jgi:hypothetical protein
MEKMGEDKKRKEMNNETNEMMTVKAIVISSDDFEEITVCIIT